jgi:hypothetical protein
MNFVPDGVIVDGKEEHCDQRADRSSQERLISRDLRGALGDGEDEAGEPLPSAPLHSRSVIRGSGEPSVRPYESSALSTRQGTRIV